VVANTDMRKRTITNAPVAESQTIRKCKILQTCLRTVVELVNCKTIRPFDLRALGYVFHNTPKVTENGIGFELRMVLDADTKREAGFSYFLCTARNEGAILPRPFTHYLEAANE
jgi:hypothetical protein